MPCSRHEYENAREEGARFQFQVAPVGVLGNEQRQATGLRLVDTELGLMEATGPRPSWCGPARSSSYPQI